MKWNSQRAILNSELPRSGRPVKLSKVSPEFKVSLEFGRVVVAVDYLLRSAVSISYGGREEPCHLGSYHENSHSQSVNSSSQFSLRGPAHNSLA